MSLVGLKSYSHFFLADYDTGIEIIKIVARPARHRLGAYSAPQLPSWI